MPAHLCRLRYFGDDRWSYAFFADSSERYLQSGFPGGSFYGKQEDAFIQATRAYLGR
ncbi:MAG: hypothetical protein A4E28_00251 [Methanocella sp. PtaU1.Bin125]|nr:MAG: hypothetical protein A4E28_00251 [Methanocella sp. PtaU1.Bin125]